MGAVPSDVIVSNVTFSSQELGPRLQQRWPFLSIDEGQVRVHGEPLARFEKRGARVTLTPVGPREAVRWVAWAIRTLCPDAEATDEDASPPGITSEPMTAEEVEQLARDIVAARLDAIAREVSPAGGAHEAVALVSYLVGRGLLELAGPMVPVARALVPLLSDVGDDIGDKLEATLLDLDEVDELFADADELANIIRSSAHIFDR
jgi:hypothetical protein